MISQTLALFALFAQSRLLRLGGRAGIDAAEITSGQVHVIGRLGRPLGTVCRLEGDFFDGDALGEKPFAGVVLLRVARVDGAALERAVLLPFRPLQRGILSPPPLEGPFDLWAYETGAYTGVPTAAWQHLPPMTTTDFSFQTSVVVFKENPV